MVRWSFRSPAREGIRIEERGAVACSLLRVPLGIVAALAGCYPIIGRRLSRSPVRFCSQAGCGEFGDLSASLNLERVDPWVYRRSVNSGQFLLFHRQESAYGLLESQPLRGWSPAVNIAADAVGYSTARRTLDCVEYVRPPARVHLDLEPVAPASVPRPLQTGVHSECRVYELPKPEPGPHVLLAVMDFDTEGFEAGGGGAGR